MSELKVIVFDVERGLCVFARTPSGHGILVDCGSTDSFSPALWLARNEVPTLVPWEGHPIAHMIVTHPHDDHLGDIANVKSELRPGILTRQKGYDWTEILNPPSALPSAAVVDFYSWQETYNKSDIVRPNLGLELYCCALSVTDAENIDPTPQHLINNSSFVVVLTFVVPGGRGAWKVVISGDNEAKGWEALLRDAEFCNKISGADFFITSHHGHESGFCADLFKIMGKPILCITSERRGDESVFNYGPFARGAKLWDEFRSHVTTRTDGSLVLRMKDDLSWLISGDNHA